MAQKLYPPNIEGTLPAFCSTKNEQGESMITLPIPYSMNRAVSRSEIIGFAVKIKPINSNRILYTDTTIDFDDNYAYFPLTTTEGKAFNIGQYYKVQLAYYNINTHAITGEEFMQPGYYSTVGVIKYTSMPEVRIDNLNKDSISAHAYDYIGVYNTTEDSSEKEYLYRFDLFDDKNNIIITTGDIIHNATDDDLNEAYDKLTINQDLEENKLYRLQYTVTTVNGLTVSTPAYRIMQKRSINPELKADLIAENNFDNGYISLRLEGKINPEDGLEYTATGDYKILRASEEDNYTTWTEILKFNLYGEKPSRWLWKDFTAKQGVHYRYGIQQYNEKISSNRIESKTRLNGIVQDTAVYSDFEDMFLYDGKRQLKIRYNPKVSSFKNVLLESKLDTIGNQFPFIFRNGNVKYKEFSLSGLISYQMDDEKLFMDETNYNAFLFSNNEFLENMPHNLVSENIATERDFKLQVLEWLNNGEMKIFRSPTEGNYIIRLINVSLSPTDTLGRMIHTFSATAYEVEKYDYSILGDLGFLQTSDPSTEQIRWETIDLSDPQTWTADNLLNYRAASVLFTDMIPGDRIVLQVRPRRPDVEVQNDFITKEIVIGATGTYNLDLQANLEIKTARFERASSSAVLHQGSLTYGFYSKIQNRFNLIYDIDIDDQPAQQFIGVHDIINEINDERTDLQMIYFVHGIKREVYPYQGKVPEDLEYHPGMAAAAGGADDPFAIYYNINGFEKDGQTYNYYDAYNNTYHNTYDPVMYINGKAIRLDDTLEQTWYRPDIEAFTTGNGVMVEMGYQIRYKTFNFDVDQPRYPREGSQESVKQLKEKYLAEATALKSLMYPKTETQMNECINTNIVVEQRDKMNAAYDNYLKLLSEAIREELLIQGEESTI